MTDVSSGGAEGATLPAICAGPDPLRQLLQPHELFIIVCHDTDGFFEFVADERAIAQRLGIKNCEFSAGIGIYDRREDAERVVAVLAGDNAGVFFTVVGTDEL